MEISSSDALKIFNLLLETQLETKISSVVCDCVHGDLIAIKILTKNRRKRIIAWCFQPKNS